MKVEKCGSFFFFFKKLLQNIYFLTSTKDLTASVEAPSRSEKIPAL
jgi:hypothetical protein